MNSHFFAYISRMRFIQRWALMRNTAPENVQEHSHQVAVLAHALAWDGACRKSLEATAPETEKELEHPIPIQQ